MDSEGRSVGYKKVNMNNRRPLQVPQTGEARDIICNKKMGNPAVGHKSSNSETDERLIKEELDAMEKLESKKTNATKIVNVEHDKILPKPKVIPIQVKPVKTNLDIQLPELPMSKDKINFFTNNFIPSNKHGQSTPIKTRKARRLRNALAYGQMIQPIIDEPRPDTPVLCRKDPLTQTPQKELMTSTLGDPSSSSMSIKGQSSGSSRSVPFPNLSSEISSQTNVGKNPNNGYATTDSGMQEKPKVHSINNTRKLQTKHKLIHPRHRHQMMDHPIVTGHLGSSRPISAESKAPKKPSLFDIISKQANRCGRYIQNKIRKMSCISVK